ncbi:MAG: HAD family hydrolase [Promethearchaeota archaeon]
MIKNIIFDLGNVILSFKPKKFLLRYTTDEDYIEEFYSKVIKSDIWLNLDYGRISLNNAKKEFLERFPEDSKFIITFFNNWKEIFTPIQSNIKILHDLKSNGYKVYFLSNFIDEGFEFIRNQYEFFSFFNGGIISCDEEVVKPEIEIYLKLINKYNLIPEESIFIDDLPKNLSPAQKLKMKTILYSANTDLRTELRKFKVSI